MKLDSVEKILAYAIDKEQDAHDFYMELAEKVSAPQMKQIFESFAQEELGHKRKLTAVRGGTRMLKSEKKILDLGIGDTLVEIELDPNISYQDVLIVAMKAEKAAFKLYTELAEVTDDADVKEMFFKLAQEEAKHKLRFEIEYDEKILKQN